MNYCLTAVVTVMFSAAGQAQSLSPQVVSSAGNTSQNGSVMLDQTIGEPVTISASAGAFRLTQGFHQPVISSVGIEEWESSHVNLYPNPASESATVTVLSDLYTAYSVIDASGRTVAEGSVEGTEFSFIVSVWSTGVYKLLLKGKSEVQLTFIKH